MNGVKGDANCDFHPVCWCISGLENETMSLVCPPPPPVIFTFCDTHQEHATSPVHEFGLSLVDQGRSGY